MTENNNDMNGPEWDNLQKMWQDSPEIDMNKLARNAKFVWWRMRINFIIEVLACILGIVLFGLMIDFSQLEFSLLGGFGVLFCMISLWMAVVIRKGAWGKPDDTALSLINLQIARAKSSIKYIKFNSYMGLGTLVILALGFRIIYIKHGTLLPNAESDPSIYIMLGVLIGLGSTAFLFPIIGWVFIKRKRRLINELKTRAAELQSDD